MPANPRLSRYLDALPNPVARAYAHAYARWLESGRRSREPSSERVPGVTAQAVRMNVEGYLSLGPKEKPLELPEKATSADWDRWEGHPGKKA